MSAFSIFAQVLGLLAFGAEVGILVLLLKHFKKKYIWFFSLYAAIPYLYWLILPLSAGRVLVGALDFLLGTLPLLGTVCFFRERRRGGS